MPQVYKAFFSLIYSTLKFQPIRETDKRSRDILSCCDWVKFQRNVNYAEILAFRIGPSSK
jgi:hypothetical protein